MALITDIQPEEHNRIPKPERRQPMYGWIAFLSILLISVLPFSFLVIATAAMYKNRAEIKPLIRRLNAWLSRKLFSVGSFAHENTK